jgi:hypothetical protein
VTLEELRAFLTSVLVPSGQTRSFSKWLRRRFAEAGGPSPAPALLVKQPEDNQKP